jgi:hypothetical protein
MQTALRLVLLLVASLNAGCGTTIFSVRVPLAEGPQTVATTDAPNIIIEDRRPASELKVHTGGGLARCERWYGDDTYVPPKLVYLEQLLAERLPDTAVRVQLQRFDTVEYCDNTANKGAAAAVAGATGALGTPVFIPARDIPGGDSVLVRVVGDVNGVPFDVSRRFDYSDLPYGFNEMPSANPGYRERLRRAMLEIADEIAAMIPAGGKG